MPTVYTDDLQKLFLEFMITDPELFVRARNIISPVYFSKKYFEAVSMFIEHSEKYQTVDNFYFRIIYGGDVFFTI